MLDMKYRWACVCNYLHDLIGWRYPHAVNGRMVPRIPWLQNWLAKQIPYDSW